MDRERLDTAVDRVYAAALGHTDWSDGLWAVAEAGGGSSARLVGLTADQAVAFSHASRPVRRRPVPPPRPGDPRWTWLLDQPVDRWWHSDVRPATGDTRPRPDPADPGTGRPRWSWSGLRLALDAGMQGLLVVEDRPGHRPIEPPGRDLLRHLGLHLRCALRLYVDRHRGVDAPPGSRRRLDAVPRPALILDEFDAVAVINTAARRWLAAAAGLTAPGQDPIAALLGDPGVRTALTRARTGPTGPVRAAMRLPPATGPVTVVAQPLGRRPASGWNHANRVLLQIQPAGDRPGPGADDLDLVFGLAEHESRTVRALVQGLTLDEVARRDDVPLGTATARLHAACRKLGVNSRRQLLALWSLCEAERLPAWPAREGSGP